LSTLFIDTAEADLSELKRIVFERPISAGALAHAKELIDLKIISSPEKPSGLFARYLRARSYEEGTFGEQNIDAAIEDYSFIMTHGEDLRSEGMVGCARLLHCKNESENAAKAIELCLDAIHIDSNVRAMMFIGYVYEHTMHDLKAAAEWYFRAFRNKLPWGLRYYASVQFKRRKFISSIFSHVAATIVSPLMVFRYGRRDAFRL
jgi:hypothetical protein